MTAQKLPKLKYLRVKNLQTAEAPQAVQLLSRLLACWSHNRNSDLGGKVGTRTLALRGGCQELCT